MKKQMIKPRAASATRPPAIPPTTAPVLIAPDTVGVLLAETVEPSPKEALVRVTERKELVALASSVLTMSDVLANPATVVEELVWRRN